MEVELKLKLKIKSESASLGFVVVRMSLGLHTKTVDDFGSGIDGNGKLGLDAVDDGDDFLFVVMENLDGVLLLLLLSDLNLGNNDDSFEDPDSVPCAFPLPAFNGTANFFLVGCGFFTLLFLPSSTSTLLLLLVQLPPL